MRLIFICKKVKVRVCTLFDRGVSSIFLYFVSEMVEFCRLTPFDLGWSCLVEETPFLIAKWADESFRFFISESSLILPLVTVISSILASSEAFFFFEQHLQHKPNTLSKAFSHQEVGIADITFWKKKIGIQNKSKVILTFKTK